MIDMNPARLIMFQWTVASDFQCRYDRYNNLDLLFLEEIHCPKCLLFYLLIIYSTFG